MILASATKQLCALQSKGFRSMDSMEGAIFMSSVEKDNNTSVRAEKLIGSFPL
jgi:hypothetical protein